MIMKNLFLLLFLLIASFGVQAQKKLLTINPASLHSPDLSDSTHAGFDRRDHLESIPRDEMSSSEIEELDSLYKKYGEVYGSAWDIIGGGCSWYCGGGNDSVYTSSSLDSTNDIGYNALMANDFSYKTAWVEGVDGSGIGEYIAYTFENHSPRVTEIIISNGYMKSDSSWSQNNRVKQLKLFVNGRPYALLNLHDSRTDQSFPIGILGRNTDGSKLVLKFEIMKVYRGTKYDDTAITEIYFDGIDVH